MTMLAPRALFYMDLRCEGGGTSDLELVDRTTSVGEARFGHLCTLREIIEREADRRRLGPVARTPGD